MPSPARMENPTFLRRRGPALARLTLLLGATLPVMTRAADDPRLRFIPGLTENFEDNGRGWPDLGQDARRESAIENGALRWRNHETGAWHVSTLTLPLAVNRPHELALDVLHRDGSHGPAGLLWGGLPDGTAHNLAVIDAAGRWQLLRREKRLEQRLADGDAGPLMAAGSPVRLSLRFLGPRSVLFINGVVAWVGDTPSGSGSVSGVAVGGGASAVFDNFIVRHVRADAAVLQEALTAYTAALHRRDQVFVTPPAQVAAGSEGWERDVAEMLGQQRYRDAAAVCRRVLATTPENPRAHSGLAWCSLHLGEIATAAHHAGAATSLDPLSLQAQRLALYVAAVQQAAPAVERGARYLALFDPRGTELPTLRADLALLAARGHAGAADAVLRRVEAQLPSAPEGFTAVALALNRAAAALVAGERETLTAAAREAVAAGERLPAADRHVVAWIEDVVGGYLARAGDAAAARPYLERAFTAFQRPDAVVQPYQRVNNAVSLALASLSVADFDRARELLAAAQPDAMALPAYANRLKADLLLALVQATATGAGDPAAERRWAAELAKVTGTGRDPWYHVHAWLARGGSYFSSRVPADVNEMKAAFEQAQALAERHDLPALAADAQAGLGTTYWKLGDKARAIQTYLAAAQREEQRRDFAAAEKLLNNLGALQVLEGDHAAAATTLRRAIALTETARATLSPADRIPFLASRASAYQFLVEALHRAGNPAELFEAMNAFRARVLAETLNLGTPPPAVSLADFQRRLTPDEAAVFYTLVGPAQVVIQVVTRDEARSVLRDGRAVLAPLKQRYLDRIHAQRPGYKPVARFMPAGDQTYAAGSAASQVTFEDFELLIELYRELITSRGVPPDVRAEVMPDIARALGEMLVDPVQPLIGRRRQVLLFPDRLLYFVPFEALPAPPARYWVERVGVRYVQSAPVWARLHERSYPADRHSFLGMGGALYAGMQEKAPPLNDPTRHVQLQLAAQRNVQAGASQREVYAALFGDHPMDYLPGSLAEVQALRTQFSDATVFTGEDMTENRIKAMAADGSLARFRIVHLATHGFAIPEIPELSGIAMTIRPLAEGGEDGYLTAPEIARLGMKADLAVLSACETGLGRIFNGEGVAGLTGSLLLGGANRALVSLWPVSDAGTMRFMRELYALTESEGVTYAEAVDRVKRRFIAGDFGPQFEDPIIWAPFVHYGR